LTRPALDEIAAAKAAAEAAGQAERAAAEHYTRGLADPHRPPQGPPRRGADPVAAAAARWQRERERARARVAAWQVKADAAAARGHRLPGAAPAPVDQQRRVRAAHTAYQHALAAREHAGSDHAHHGGDRARAGRADQPRANLTDPDSRVLKTRTGWIQGYNCFDAVSQDQFIIHAEATQHANDVHQFPPTAAAVTHIAAHLAAHTGRDDLTIGTMIGDAGFDSHANLTAHGPDRLIANAKRHTIDHRAATDPTTGDPPEHANPRQAMDHRLRTPEGHQLYKRRAPLIEAPHGWLKDRRGLRQFTRRGLTAARSELRLAAAVTNLLRLHTLGITTSQLATR
jgi:hypothetical protein